MSFLSTYTRKKQVNSTYLFGERDDFWKEVNLESKYVPFPSNTRADALNAEDTSGHSELFLLYLLAFEAKCLDMNMGNFDKSFRALKDLQRRTNSLTDYIFVNGYAIFEICQVFFCHRGVGFGYNIDNQSSVTRLQVVLFGHFK